MEDLEVLGRTGELVNEEHERLRQLEVNLNRRWDPPRQRRVLREAGYDRDEATVRDEKVLEGY